VSITGNTIRAPLRGKNSSLFMVVALESSESQESHYMPCPKLSLGEGSLNAFMLATIKC